jgi:hypothetical protein
MVEAYVGFGVFTRSIGIQTNKRARKKAAKKFPAYVSERSHGHDGLFPYPALENFDVISAQPIRYKTCLLFGVGPLVHLTLTLYGKPHTMIEVAPM